MASGYVQVPPDSTGKKVDCTSISSGAVRQVVTVGDPTTSSGLATVTGGRLNVNASVGTVTVQGNVSATIIGSLPNINVSSMPAVNISAMPNVNINGISATVTIAGTVAVSGGSLAVSNNIGVDRIVQTVNAVLTQAINISSMPAISVGPISTIDKISQTVLAVITNNINISSMPAISIGPISTIDKISATVLAAITNRISIDSISGIATVVGQTAQSLSGALSWPVLVGGIDTGGLVRTLKTNANGELTVNVSSMPAISVGPISTIDKISATVQVAGVVTMPTSLVAANGQTATVIGKVLVVTDTNDYVYVSGPKAPGSPASGYYPVQMGGIDGSGNARQLKMDTSGNVQVGIVGTATVTGVVTLGAGSANIGTINGISATVTVVNSYPRAVASASHGPVTKSLSASASVALVAAPGAAQSIYVTSMLVTNGSPTLTQLQVYEASATAAPTLAPYLAASGGGFQHTFDPPWKVSANTALNARLKPSVGGVVTVTINFVVGA